MHTVSSYFLLCVILLQNDKDLILWAIFVEIKQKRLSCRYKPFNHLNEALSTFKVPFRKTSQNKLLHIQDELDFADEQIAENQRSPEEANDDTEETDKLKEFSEKQEDIQQTQIPLNIPSYGFRMKFEMSFSKTNARKKHLCHFFIVDLNDVNYQKHTLFSDAELPEFERLSQ
ncbi:hypothetical protein AB4K20DRAFT_1866506 [Rhizopus microsporus]